MLVCTDMLPQAFQVCFPMAVPPILMVTLFALFAEVERDLISERTKEGLAAARAKGRLLGRPRGTLGRSKLDGREEEIQMLLRKGVPKASIAKITDVSRTNLLHFIKTRNLNL